ncbi:hypothetical protein OH460_09140 [Vibrio sp. Makdt]|uniref:hypothetical protein n=1 Tax=Vibrio sp. Makdt TaxID=2998828 RepID=UPI0022CDB26A|nr:hypothetical protein [Vibrio sp. Makdt]MDA0152467.1 hypothetical protein [Vibrio sp. Makdt]
MKSKLVSSMSLALTLMASSSAFSNETVDPFLKAISSSKNAKQSEFFSPVASGAEWLATLPSNAGLFAIKLKTGQFMIMDAGFRYAFYANNLFDIIRGQEITTVDELNDVWLIDTEKLSSNNVPIFSYGLEKPQADLVIFMPMVKNNDTINIANMLNENKDKLRIDIVLIGSHDPKQINTGAHLFCAKDRKLAKERLSNLEFPKYGEKDTYLDQHATCNKKHMMAGLAIARMYNIFSFPYFVNKNGATNNGVPEDINEFVTLTPVNPSHSRDLTDPNWNKQ